LCVRDDGSRRVRESGHYLRKPLSYDFLPSFLSYI
jgi:hypothetical protein